MFNTIDLFSGCGGLTEGFKQSKKYRLVAALDWELDTVTTLKQRLATRWGVKDADQLVLHFDIQRTDELIGGYSNDPVYGTSAGLESLAKGGAVDVVIGGPPCQAYSIAGRISDKNNMEDDYRNYLFESYLEVIKHFRPKACVFENVTGMLSAKPGGVQIIDRIAKAFKEAGYVIAENIARDATFDLSEFSVPQKRKRVIIAAFCEKQFSDPYKKIESFYSKLNSYKNLAPKTVEQAILDLPAIYPLDNPERRKSHYLACEKTPFEFDHNPRYHNPRDVEIFKLLAADIESEQYKYASTEALKQLYTEKTGRTSSVHKYHVLRTNEPSNTIPAHLSKDGLRHIHPSSKQARSITVREAARLQTFPDDFMFYGSNGSKYRMIGNAVPPLFSKYIAKSLADILNN